MKRLAVEGSRDVEVREAALDALREAGVPSHDFLGEIRALFEWVRDRIRFVRDPFRHETLQSPRYTLEVRAGDCDDRATLLASMLRSVGVEADLSFKVVAANPQNPRAFSHVYVIARLGGKAIPLDPTFMGTPAGWELGLVSRSAEFAL